MLSAPQFVSSRVQRLVQASVQPQVAVQRHVAVQPQVTAPHVAVQPQVFVQPQVSVQPQVPVQPQVSVQSKQLSPQSTPLSSSQPPPPVRGSAKQTMLPTPGSQSSRATGRCGV